MSETHNTNEEETPRGDGEKNYATPRYRPGSRRKQHRIVAVGVRRESPDLERFARAIIESVMRQEAKREAEAKAEAKAAANDAAEKQNRNDEDGQPNREEQP